MQLQQHAPVSHACFCWEEDLGRVSFKEKNPKEKLGFDESTSSYQL